MAGLIFLHFPYLREDDLSNCRRYVVDVFAGLLPRRLTQL